MKLNHLGILIIFVLLLIGCADQTSDTIASSNEEWAILDANSPASTPSAIEDRATPILDVDIAIDTSIVTITASAGRLPAVGVSQAQPNDSTKTVGSSNSTAQPAATRTAPSSNTSADNGGQAQASTPVPTATTVWVPPTSTNVPKIVGNGNPTSNTTSDSGQNNEADTSSSATAPTRVPAATQPPRATRTPIPTPFPTPTPTPIPTVVPIPANAPFFPESPVRPFDQTDIRANLEKSVATFHDFILGWGPILQEQRESNRGDCGSYLGWYTHWVTEVPVYTDVPQEWGRLYYDYRVIMDRASYFTNNVRRRCPAVYPDLSIDRRNFPDNEEIVSWFNANKANLERLRNEAQSLP